MTSMTDTVFLYGGSQDYGNYRTALASVGLRAVVSRSLTAALGCGGLLLPGGGDIHGSLPPEEAFLLRAFWEAHRPILGVCRGMQCVNVALGGTLHQDIASHAGTRHIVRFCENSPFAPLREAVVNSFHHQSAARLAPPLFPAAVAGDGTIEAVSSNVSPVLAVQWHPERPDGGVTDEFFRIVRQMLEASD